MKISEKLRIITVKQQGDSKAINDCEVSEFVVGLPSYHPKVSVFNGLGMRHTISSCSFKNILYWASCFKTQLSLYCSASSQEKMFLFLLGKSLFSSEFGDNSVHLSNSWDLTEAALFAFSVIFCADRSLPEQSNDETLSYSETLTYSLFDHSFCQACSPFSRLSPAALSQKPLQQNVRIIVLEVISSMLSLFYTLY